MQSNHYPFKPQTALEPQTKTASLLRTPDTQEDMCDKLVFSVFAAFITIENCYLLIAYLVKQKSFLSELCMQNQFLVQLNSAIR